MIVLHELESATADALLESLVEGVEKAKAQGGEASWRRHFRTSMPMCIA